MYHNLWKCNLTISEMLKARGYNESSNSDDFLIHSSNIKSYMDFEKLIKKFCHDENNTKKGKHQYTLNQNVLDRLTYLNHHPYTDGWIYVFFVIDKIGVDVINSYLGRMEQDNVSRSILISVPNENKTTLGDQSVLTPFAVKEIKKIKDTKGKIIEHFYFDDMTINILKHKLQPKKIVILTNDEKDEIFSNLIMEEEGVPPLARILPTDPISRFLGLQQGDVIKCVCYSETTGECNRYRICWN